MDMFGMMEEMMGNVVRVAQTRRLNKQKPPSHRTPS